MVWDFGIIAGPGVSVAILQAALGIAADGMCGPVTKGAATASSGPELCAKLHAGQGVHFTGLPRLSAFRERLDAARAG